MTNEEIKIIEDIESSINILNLRCLSKEWLMKYYNVMTDGAQRAINEMVRRL